MPQATYQRAEFLISAAKYQQLPEDSGYEVAFAGRSNAGKSSTLNSLTQRKRLAHVSKTPGRTQLINLFQLDEQRRIVDLPGYGYAKVPQAVKARWQKTLQHYLERRQCLQGLVLVMDVRHPMTEFDQEMLNWCQHFEMPCHILLNKTDKLKRGPANSTLLQVQQQLTALKHVSVQLFSATTQSGLAQLQHTLDHWYDLAP